MKPKKIKLSPVPSRLAGQNLTDREVASLLGGFIGNLCNYTDSTTVRRAVQWWAQQNDAWAMLAQASPVEPQLREMAERAGIKLPPGV